MYLLCSISYSDVSANVFHKDSLKQIAQQTLDMD